MCCCKGVPIACISVQMPCSDRPEQAAARTVQCTDHYDEGAVS